MYIQEKKSRLILLVTITILMVLLLNIISEDEKNNIEMNERVQKFCREKETELALYKTVFNGSAELSEILIRCWENPEEETYYLFLPSGRLHNDMFWLVAGHVSVWIEQEKIVTGDMFDLTCGKYKLVLEGEKERKECSLVIMQSSSVATLFIETTLGSLEYIHEEKGKEDSGKYLLLNEAGVPESVGELEEIRGRGNVSWVDSEKRGYQITLADKKALLGMPTEKQWILVPNAFDDTLLKNKICYDIAYGMGLDYTPECEYADIYINGEYRGNYLICEKVEIDDNRVAIKELEREIEELNQNIENAEKFEVVNEEGVRLKGSILENEPKDITGGYLLELETEKRFEGEESGFVTVRGQSVTVNSPKYASQNQVSYVAERYQCLENALYSEDGCCPKDGKKFTEYIDLKSFAKKYLLEELSKNFDASITSQFIYKPEDTVSNKFFAGPAWDYDKSLGIEEQNRVGLNLNVPEGIHAGVQEKEYDLWYGLYRQDEFLEEVYDIFEKELKWIVKKEVRYKIPELVEKIKDSVRMNHARWNIYGQLCEEESVKKYNADVEKIRDFIDERMDYLENEWGL